MLNNKVCEFKRFFSIFSFAKMDTMMTVCAKSLQIFRVIIFSILIQMMNTKYFQVFIPAKSAHYFSIYFKTLRKSFWDIRNFRSQRSMYKGRTVPRTKSFFSRLKSNASCDDFSTQLTRISLNAT